MSAKEILITVGLVGAAAAAGLDSTRQPVPIGEGPVETVEQPAPPDTTETSVYYPGCNEVRALGKAPLYAGQPGYRIGMDGDGDRIACEPHR